MNLIIIEGIRIFIVINIMIGRYWLG